MIDTSYIAQLKRFSLIVRKKITSSYSGQRRSTATGRGMTIKDYREYVKGDDTRLLDWKVFARTDKLYIKQYEEDKSLTVHIIVDASASMDFGEKYSKFDFSSMVGMGYAYLALKDNDKFEFSTFANDLMSYKAKRGMGHLAFLVERLNETTVKGPSAFEQNMTKYRKNISGKSMVIIISDFLFDIEEIKQGLLRLGKQELKVIQVLDQREINLDMEGDVKLQDSESDQVFRTYISRKMKDQYKQKLDSHAAKIKDVCDKLGADFTVVTTDMPIFDAFHLTLQR